MSSTNCKRCGAVRECRQGPCGESLPADCECYALGYSISAYLYRKNHAVIRVPSDEGFKTRAARVAEGCGGEYVNRCRGYLLPRSKLDTYRKLVGYGWDGTSGIAGKVKLTRPGSTRELTYPEAKRAVSQITHRPVKDHEARRDYIAKARARHCCTQAVEIDEAADVFIDGCGEVWVHAWVSAGDEKTQG